MLPSTLGGFHLGGRILRLHGRHIKWPLPPEQYAHLKCFAMEFTCSSTITRICSAWLSSCEGRRRGGRSWVSSSWNGTWNTISLSHEGACMHQNRICGIYHKFQTSSSSPQYAQYDGCAEEFPEHAAAQRGSTIGSSSSTCHENHLKAHRLPEYFGFGSDHREE